MNLSDVKQKTTGELVALADELSIAGADSLHRPELVLAILRAQSDRRGGLTGSGVLEILPDGFGFLRAPDANYLPGADDIYVSPSQIRRFDLRTGDTVEGQIRPPKENERYFALLKVEAVNHGPVDGQRGQLSFEERAAIYPDQRLRLAADDGEMSARVVDLVCPLGKGQRALVCAPPHTGKSAILRVVARAIAAGHPTLETLMVLVDERPEDVTETRRSASCEVIASIFDESPARHVQLAEIVVEKAKRLAENGRDVVVLFDSITRLARAYHAASPPSGRDLEGGIDAAAMHRVKRLFGAARALEGGGSLTMIAAATDDTGSSGDAIARSLVDAATARIQLSRALADARIFPSIDVTRSFTREAERLWREDEASAAQQLRELAQEDGPADAMRRLIARLEATAPGAPIADL